MSISRVKANQDIIDSPEVSEYKDFDKEQKFADRELEAFAIHNKGLEEFYGHRKMWSYWIIGWITASIVFNISLTYGTGRQWFDFENMQWFVTSVAAETFIQIVGLGYVAARYLFSREQRLDRSLRAKFQI